MTVSEVVDDRGTGGGGDRVFKWVAAIAGACLVGFVVFVVVRGPSHPTSGAPPP